MTESPDDDEDAAAADHARQVQALSAELWPLIAPRLAGRPPEVQSSVLADLAAGWLAGHVVAGDPAATTRLRAELFDLFVRLVADLVRPTSMMMHGHE